ncbi:hypothetical protein AOL_s00210g87 [Orbilia oligospora ATCC 24927]|uniref:Uncharacterized protein n=2 Tax=Orbilia oligospora TaxID=2813651 RepID=G1XRS9_ARTOA|nr:hypothetical protein AOL_s00210g87 [Orbilia oligospora ATCC 24927]EGX44106.1 hypothetical protein AOL_s00210g87 [Orbilia oligospora ATCC 24927]
MLCKTGAGKLPVELFQEVTKDMPQPISREEAENYKEELMQERVKFRENSPAVTGMTAQRFRYIMDVQKMTDEDLIKTISREDLV